MHAQQLSQIRKVSEQPDDEVLPPRYRASKMVSSSRRQFSILILSMAIAFATVETQSSRTT